MKLLGAILADIYWCCRWRTWALNYVEVSTALANAIHRGNARILKKLNDGA